MFNQQGLSLDQAPPFEVVLRFFVFGALWGVLGGIWIAVSGEQALDPASMHGRIAVHMFTIGVMLSFMLGALFQMLPVVAGIVLGDPVRLGAAVQIGLTVGLIGLLTAFWTLAPWAFGVAAVALGGVLVPFGSLIAVRLVGLKSHGASSRGMLAAVGAFLLTVVLGIYLVATLGGAVEGSAYTWVRTWHYSAGLYGWIALLIIAISFQTIEMFYVTPPHPNIMRKGLGWIVLGGLLLYGGLLASGATEAVFWSERALLAVLIGYALVTLRRLSQRKRPLADATVWFWRTGLIALSIAAVAEGVGGYRSAGWIGSIGVTAYATFALSIVLAMFYKIVPFLTWFHLNAQGYFNAPMMHEVIHPSHARYHLYLHWVSVAVVSAAAWVPAAVYLGGVLLSISFAIVAYQTLAAWRTYRHIRAHGERFDFPTVSS
jgi:hypothetical protein